MSETLNQILIWLSGFLGSISISSVIQIIYNAYKLRKIKKWIEHNNNQEIAKEQGERAVLQTVEQIKNVTFKQNIQPIVEAELEKVNEKSAKFIEQELKKTQEGYKKLVKVIENLAAYFDNSIGVSEEAKQNLKNALTEAKIEPTIENDIELEEIVVEENIEPKKAKSKVKVER